LRRECLDQMLVFGEAHLRRILSAYATYYNQARTHMGIGREYLLPFRDFHMRASAARDHEWRTRETIALGLNMFTLRTRVLGAKSSGNCRTG
jgi:hypothetical protein